MIIVTHTSPDFDAIGAVWLLQRHGGMESADVVFINTGNPDPAVLLAADAVVDTGRELDAGRRRFDHHHLPGAEANETCATSLVHAHLFGDLPHYLDPLIFLIYNGDTGKPSGGANWSRQIGIHALLSQYKAEIRDDAAILGYGITLLDRLAASLLHQEEARASLEEHTVYRSADGLLIALKDAPRGATFAAYDAGARLVVFADYDKNAIGIWRGGEGQDVHCGDLVKDICSGVMIRGPVDEAVVSELLGWYRHEAGFYAGRGTDKAPSDQPILIDVADVARALDAAWRRA